MDATEFKAAIASMSNADLREVVEALERARHHATQLKISARPPECAAFGAIARDLDYSLSLIRRSAQEGPVTEDRESGEVLAAALAEFVTGAGRETLSRP